MTVHTLTSELDRAAEALAGAGHVSLACHELPDGDALGSMLALMHLCLSQGKKVTAAWPAPDRVAPHYRWLPGLDQVVPASEFPGRPPVMVTFDCGSLDRLGRLGDAAQAAPVLIVIDHHATAAPFGTINLIDPDAAATAVVVRQLAARLGWPLTRDAAACLYTGLVTDTGRFQYSNTTPETFRLAMELAGFDLPIADINRELFEKQTFALVRLTGRCLARAELDLDAGMVAAWVTSDELAEAGVEFEETEGLIDLVRRTAEVDVAVVARQCEEGVRVSLRSISEMDVGRVAVALGGGGHTHAAGFVHSGGVAEAIDAVRFTLRQHR
ncbi:MAG TPA: DHH family phosphoesterase [Acidimicrobiales bacterium]|nr:DHH family phosphoesterase [Acidimicrobiales bacterium]